MNTTPVNKPISVFVKLRSLFKKTAKLDMNWRSTKFITFRIVTKIKKDVFFKFKIIYSIKLFNLS